MAIHAATVPTQTRTALVLDDDPMIRSEIGEMLEDLDYRIRYCADFIGALEEMEFDASVSLVVADYHLLGDAEHTFNGMRFIDCCRMRYPERAIRYFLVSGDRAPLMHNADDTQVPMIPKVEAIERLLAYLAPDYVRACA